jgi:parallel beta-helix repeat protein
MTTLIPKFDLKNGGSTPTGAINRPINKKLQEFVSIQDFGAVGNGTTDDTAAIQAAITATPSGGCLYIPYGDYLVTSGLVANVSMNIVGEGWSEAGGSRLIVSSSMSGTTDVLTMNGYISGAYEGVTLSDFSIVPQSGTPARYGINLGNAKGLNRATIERIKIGTLGTGSILNNGAFSSTIQNCLLNTGIWFNKGTDNQNVLNNTISGAGYGIYVDCVAGSNMFNIEGNVIVNTSGGVYIQNAGTMTIANNQFEQQVASDTAESTIIYALGNPRQIESLQIYGNNFNADPTLVNYSITLQNTQSVCIYNNHFSGALPYPKQAIAINSSSYSARIYGNYIYGNNTGATADSANQQYNQIYDATYFPEGRFTDLGIGTCGLWKKLSYSAYTDVTANANYSPLSIKKSENNNQVFFRGGVNVASPANGKTIVAIPAGFQVQNNVIMSTTARVTATGLFIPITLYISYSTQTITIQNVPSSLASIELSFEGCSYFYYFG